jgi:hypothetical protein
MSMSDSVRNKQKNAKKIELAFPKYEEQNEEYISKGKGEDLIKYLSTSMDEIANWFKQYHVDSIELSISGAIETGSIIKLIVGAKGEGGLKVTLKPFPSHGTTRILIFR